MTLLVRPEAKHDILEAAEWYDGQQPGLGQNFVAIVEQSFLRIAAGPERFTRAHRGLRRALVHKFPYAVYFDEQGTDQIVLAVVHQRRDFNLLDERLKR